MKFRKLIFGHAKHLKMIVGTSVLCNWQKTTRKAPNAAISIVSFFMNQTLCDSEYLLRLLQPCLVFNL